MSTIKDDRFDYQAFVKENPPDGSKVKRGTTSRRHRLETTIGRFMVRIDENILEEFQQLVSRDQQLEKLINQALREWLSARGVKELIREELENIVSSTLPGTGKEKVKQKNESKLKSHSRPKEGNKKTKPST